MIFEIIKRCWVRGEIKKTINNRSVSCGGTIDRILLLCHKDEVSPLELREKIAGALNVRVDTITLVVWDPSKNEQEEVPYLKVDKKMLGFLGGVKQDKVKQVLSKEYSLQLNYFIENNLELSYLSGIASAALKAEIGKNIHGHSDVQIDMELEHPDVFARELKKYWNIIK